MNLIKLLYLKISRSKKTDTEKLTELAEEMVNTICQSVFDGKKLSYSQKAHVLIVFKTGITKHLAEAIEAHKTEKKRLTAYHNMLSNEAYSAINEINRKTE